MEEHATLNKKEQLLKHFKGSIDWVQALSSIAEENWRLPIEPGKWSVAEVISHLVAWDKFVLNQRIPYLFTHQEMPAAPDVEVVNEEAAIQARAEEKEDTIERFCEERRHFVQVLHHFEESDFEKEILIRSKPMTLYDYLLGLAEHDNHHFTQIAKLIEIPPQ
ncbi:DinB family protein [Halobacillus salinarum]|uniref:DinB family protein n=1 Tax=Halobacillus salinarum TaxID=2932257 RepID=A0ABY4EIH9_9BACI|nr:DinB family protein [Halobacillus salinarum]UOQ43683.1 DinB family protein [Halobacillus salinarum]